MHPQFVMNSTMLVNEKLNEIFGQPHMLKSIRTHAHLKGRIAKLKVWRSLIKLVQSSALRSRKSMFLGGRSEFMVYMKTTQAKWKKRVLTPPHKVFLLSFSHLPTSTSGICLAGATLQPVLLSIRPTLFSWRPTPTPADIQPVAPFFRPITKDTRQHAFSLQDIGNPSHWYSAPKHGPCSIVVWPREHSCGKAQPQRAGKAIKWSDIPEECVCCSVPYYPACVYLSGSWQFMVQQKSH